MEWFDLKSIRESLTSIQGLVVSLAALGAAAVAVFRPVREWMATRRRAFRGHSPDRRKSKEIAVRAVKNLRELRTVADFDIPSYGSSNHTSLDEVKSWWSAYPEGLWAAFRGRDPVGVFGLFPVTNAWAEDLISGKVKESDLTSDVIKASERHTWYFSGISLKHRKEGISKILPRLLCLGIHRWANHELDGTESRSVTVLAIGSTAEGEDLLDYFNFEIARGDEDGSGAIYRRRIDREKLNTFLRSSRFCSCCRAEYHEF